MAAAVAAILGAPRFARAHGAAPRPDDIEALALAIRAASREGALDVAAQAMRAGAGHGGVLAAAFLAGVADIRPRPHGILHSVMMVESAYELAAAAGSEREAALVALWNVDDFKRSQERDREEDGDYVMKPLDAGGARKASADEARREFLAAMDAWDAPRAERAVAALHPHATVDSFFEIFWPIAARCYAFIGHKMIYAVQTERALRRIGWEHAEPALRSLVLSLLVERNTAANDRVRSLAPKLPAGWLGGKEDADRVEPLARAFREASPAAASEVAIAAFAEGTGPATVFDALTLVGSEVFARRPGKRSADGRDSLLPVHALTVTSAFRHAFLAARDDATKRLMALQAASWLASLRDDLGRMVGLSMAGLDPAAAGEPPKDLDAVFESGSPASARALLERSPDATAEYLARIRSALFRRGREHHQHKYAAAMEEESARVAPRFRARIVAPAIDYLAHPADTETDVYRRSLKLL